MVYEGIKYKLQGKLAHVETRHFFFFFLPYLERLFRGNELKEPVSSRFLVFRIISPLVACPRGNISPTFFSFFLFFFRTRGAELLYIIIRIVSLEFELETIGLTPRKRFDNLFIPKKKRNKKCLKFIVSTNSPFLSY